MKQGMNMTANGIKTWLHKVIERVEAVSSRTDSCERKYLLKVLNVESPDDSFLQNVPEHMIPMDRVLLPELQRICEKDKLLHTEFVGITYKSSSLECATVFRTGYNVDDFDIENHGIKWCENNPRSYTTTQIKLLFKNNSVAIGLLENSNDEIEESVPGYIETK